jgi:IS5 family transposase
VLRCAVLKQHRQLSYEELAFHLEDSASFRAFARLPPTWTPKKSVLHKTISAVQAPTWEAINRTVLTSARKLKVEAGDVIRLDSTVTEALMPEPSDSSLLWDAVRVVARLLKAAERLGVKVVWRDRRRAARRRARAIEYTPGRPRRVARYCELIKITRAMPADLDMAAAQLDPAPRPLAEICAPRSPARSSRGSSARPSAACWAARSSRRRRRSSACLAPAQRAGRRWTALTDSGPGAQSPPKG